MWTPLTRRRHARRTLRHETDLTGAEWALVEPFMPKPFATGRPREWPPREVKKRGRTSCGATGGRLPGYGRRRGA